MVTIDLTGRHALVLGVANHRSLSWAIAQQLHAAGATLCITYPNERMKDGVLELADKLPGVLTLECDVTIDAQVDAVAGMLTERWGSLEMLSHGVAFAIRSLPRRRRSSRMNVVSSTTENQVGMTGRNSSAVKVGGAVE